MRTIFVPDDDWNSHYDSPEECIRKNQKYGDLTEGKTFSLVRLTVGAHTTYRVIDGKPVPVEVAFPDPPADEGSHD